MPDLKLIENKLEFIPAKVKDAYIFIVETVEQNINVKPTIVSKNLEMNGEFVSRANLRLILEIPIMLDMERISIRVRGSRIPFDIASKHTTVEVNYNSSDVTLDLSSLPNTPTQMAVDIPLVSSGFTDDRAMLDHVNIIGEHEVHHTVRVKGDGEDYRVRVIMHQLTKRFEISSISTSSIDKNRLKKSFNRTASYSKEKIDTITSTVKRKWDDYRNKPTLTIPNDELNQSNNIIEIADTQKPPELEERN